MPKHRGRAKNLTKIVDLLQELNLTESKYNYILRETNIRVDDGQKNLDQQEVGRIRKFLNEERRKAEMQSKTISIPPILKVKDLATSLELSVGEILAALLKNGVMATLNDDVDYDTAAIIAEDLGYQTEENVAELEKDVLTAEKLEEILKKEDPKEQSVRPPVVTILGHVDHGKTTLLDTIRKSNVAGKEAGGITQAISSYQVTHNDRDITFIDTPGHETFEFMRQQGASLADIAILVVAADDGVKPQTKEAAAHAKAAGVPIVVAINKMDKEGANPDKVKAELAEIDLQPEEWGGKTTVAPVSALKGDGIEELLELVLLTADIDKPQAIIDRPALGSVIESRLDKNLGPLAAVLVHTGTINVGDDIVVGKVAGRVRRLMDWKGKDVKAALPSAPVTLVGLDDVPHPGSVLQVVEARGEARAKAGSRRSPIKSLTSSDDEDDRSTLALVLKADSHGSLQALKQTIEAMVPSTVRLSIIRAEVGNVSDSDVLTAQAGNAIIYAFNVAAGGMAQKLADKEHVPVKSYDVIYQLVDDVQKEIDDRLPFDVVRTDLGRLKVLKVFFSTQKKKIAGGDMIEGVAEVGAKVTIWRKTARDKEEVGSGEILEMQIEKKAVQKAETGDQVGFTIEGQGKIKDGDTLEIYKEEKVARKE